MLSALIHPVSPYQGFDIAAFKPDLQGWNSVDPIFESVLGKLKPKRIVEVGSWKGLSAIHMASLLKKSELRDFEILCVDTWLGSYEHWLERDDPMYFDSLRLKHGFPRLYEQFLANVLITGHADVITPFPLASGQAAMFLRLKNVEFDLIYIDGAHDEAGVKADLDAYWPLLRSGGVMLGDDYNELGVRRAADGFTTECEVPLGTAGNKFLIVKP